MKKFKTIGRVILAFAIIVCIGLDFWTLYIHLYGKEKVNSYTFKIGQQTAQAIDPTTGEVTEDSRWFAEVNIYDNCYEILFNYFTDETRTEFYSQGLQFYTNNDSVDLSNALNSNYSKSSTYLSIFGVQEKTKGSLYTFYYKNPLIEIIKEDNKDKIITQEVDREKVLGFLWTTSITEETTYYKNVVLEDKFYSNLTVSNFASANNYEDSIYSSNPFNKKSFFTVQIGEETYFMKLRGSDTDYLSKNKDKFYFAEERELSPFNSYNKDGKTKVYEYNYNYYYRSCDVYYLAELIYNSCQALDCSSEGIPITFEFGDYFQYYTDYSAVIQDKNVSDKVLNYVKSYWQIKVQKHQGNMTKASQSLFGTFKGSTNYNESESDDAGENEIFTDYHHGRTILDLNENYFDKILIKNSDGLTYKLFLSLKEDFKKIYEANSRYRLRIAINLDNLNYDNLSFNGFVSGTLDGYSIYKITTTSTESGEVVENDITSEVIVC